jgi:hypothetical protein
MLKFEKKNNKNSRKLKQRREYQNGNAASRTRTFINDNTGQFKTCYIWNSRNNYQIAELRRAPEL